MRWLRQHLGIVGYALLALGLLGAVARSELHNNAHQKAVCQAIVDARSDQRATWERARQYLLAQTPPDRQAPVNAFIDDVLMAIKPLECVDHKPVEQKGAS